LPNKSAIPPALPVGKRTLRVAPFRGDTPAIPPFARPVYTGAKFTRKNNRALIQASYRSASKQNLAEIKSKSCIDIDLK
jgi:hypothetical protein